MIRGMLVICLMSVVSFGFSDEPTVSRVLVVGGGVGEVVEGEVVEVAAAGVTVKPVGDGLLGRVVPWYEIRAGEGGWEVPGEFEEIARAAAIGKARRDRGDLRGCAELYSSIAVEYLGSSSEMAEEVFSGLLEEALVRGDFFDAAVAMLALEGASASGWDGFDRRYGVDVGVAMLWGVGGVTGVGGHRLEEIAGVMEEESEQWKVLIRGFRAINGDDSAGDVAVVIEELKSAVRGGGEYRMGVELYSKMLIAQRDPDADARDDARAWLGARSRMKAGSWIDAWSRCAVGASYLYESELVGGDDELVSRGVVELVYVMVGHRDQRGGIGGLGRWAMVRATGALRERGRFDEAGALLMSFDRMAVENE